jgi:hypothetical protein
VCLACYKPSSFRVQRGFRFPSTSHESSITSHFLRVSAANLVLSSRSMVRPERRVVLAGESPVRVSAGAPGSRLQPGGEIRPSRAECRKPFNEEGEQTSGPQQSVNAIASSDYQPKGVWESRAAHVPAKATDNILDRNGCWSSPGSQAAARWDRAVRNRRDPTWQPSRAKTEHIRSEG